MEMNNTAPMNTTFAQIKAESGTRSHRIREILKAAFTQTSSELKEGYTIVRPLASDMTATVVKDLKQKQYQASSTVQEAWGQDADSLSVWDRWQRVLRVVATAIKQTVAPPLQKQATRVDAKFADQYGGTYVTIKRGLQSLKNWYVQSTNAEDASRSQTQPLTVIPKENAVIDVVASPLESTAQ